MNQDESYDDLVSVMGQGYLEEGGDALDEIFDEEIESEKEIGPTREELREIEKRIDSELEKINFPPSSDSLSAYFKSIAESGRQLLTCEEEVHWIEIMQGTAEGDPKEARDLLIESNLRLVISIARKYLHRGLDFEDLIQEGNRGLMIGIDRFDLSYECRISTYVYWWIRQAIIRTIYQATRTIRLPVSIAQTLNRIKSARIFLEKMERITDPSPSQIAQHTGLPLEKIIEALEAPSSTLSLETPAGAEKENALGDFIPDTQNPEPSDTLEKLVMRKLVLKRIHQLSPREAKIIMHRFGFSTEPETFGNEDVQFTLSEIGEREYFNASRERVRIIEAQALKKLKQSGLGKELGLFDPKSEKSKRK
jgi:RNA polymerase primary sigma factor